MAPRITELLTYLTATTTAFAPIVFLLAGPPAQERLATQTARWAPRWERSISRVAPHVERNAVWVGARVERAVKGTEHIWRPRVERVAKGLEGSIRSGVDRVKREAAGRWVYVRPGQN